MINEAASVPDAREARPALGSAQLGATADVAGTFAYSPAGGFVPCAGNNQSLTVVFTALGTIFRTGAYIYATTGKAPSSMDPALLQGAFHKK